MTHLRRWLLIAAIACGLLWGLKAPLEALRAKQQAQEDTQGLERIRFALRLLAVPEPVCRMDATSSGDVRGLWVVVSTELAGHCHVQEVPPCEEDQYVIGRLAEPYTIRGREARVQRLTGAEAVAVWTQANHHCGRRTL